MRLRHDAALVAARLAIEARNIVGDFGPPQVATVGSIRQSPNLVNAVARAAIVPVDLRHTEKRKLKEAEQRLFDSVQQYSKQDGCTIDLRTLARLEPVEFDSTIVANVARMATELGFSVMRLPSGAGPREASDGRCRFQLGMQAL